MLSPEGRRQILTEEEAQHLLGFGLRLFWLIEIAFRMYLSNTSAGVELAQSV
jgi:hypothetical protein